eukprot:3933309-Rhodomonas_salina.1
MSNVQRTRTQTIVSQNDSLGLADSADSAGAWSVETVPTPAVISDAASLPVLESISGPPLTPKNVSEPPAEDRRKWRRRRGKKTTDAGSTACILEMEAGEDEKAKASRKSRLGKEAEWVGQAD